MPLLLSVTFLGLLVAVASTLPNLIVVGEALSVVGELTAVGVTVGVTVAVGVAVAVAVGAPLPVAVGVAVTVFVGVAVFVAVAVGVADPVDVGVAVGVAVAVFVAVEVAVGVADLVDVAVAVAVAVLVAVAVTVGVPPVAVAVAVAVGNGVGHVTPLGSITVRNAFDVLFFPLFVTWNAFGVIGKSVEYVSPATTISPNESSAIPPPISAVPVPPNNAEKMSSFTAVACDVSSSLANAVTGTSTRPPPKLNPLLWLSSRRNSVLQAKAFALSGKSCPALVPLVVAPVKYTLLPIT